MTPLHGFVDAFPTDTGANDAVAPGFARDMPESGFWAHELSRVECAAVWGKCV